MKDARTACAAYSIGLSCRKLWVASSFLYKDDQRDGRLGRSRYLVLTNQRLGGNLLDDVQDGSSHYQRTTTSLSTTSRPKSPGMLTGTISIKTMISGTPGSVSSATSAILNEQTTTSPKRNDLGDRVFGIEVRLIKSSIEFNVCFVMY